MSQCLNFSCDFISKLMSKCLHTTGFVAAIAEAYRGSMSSSKNGKSEVLAASIATARLPRIPP